MTQFFADNGNMLMLWAGAISTIAMYSILYGENRFYRLFEHIFIGLAAGYSIYITWSIIIRPRWIEPMYYEGQWYWIFALVAGSMFYFMYSKRYVWISRIIIGAFMGLAAGGIFREFFEIYFPQIRSSMRPISEIIAATPGQTVLNSAEALVFYVILFSSMLYFFFSFDFKGRVVKKAALYGRWFLMIGFGAMFGATVMGRMTLFIGRFNFLINDWGPVAGAQWQSSYLAKAVITLIAAGSIAIAVITARRANKSNESSSGPQS